MRVPFLSLFLLAWPLSEIAAFVVVGKAIGLWATLGIVIGTAILGSLLIRSQGMALLQKLSQESREGRAPGVTLIQGGMVVVAGILLLLPGLITDAIGALLLVPFIRRMLWTAVGKRIVVVGRGAGRNSAGRTPSDHGHNPFSTGTHDRPHGQGPVVDLDEADFQREPKHGNKPESPWSKGREIDG